MFSLFFSYIVYAIIYEGLPHIVEYTPKLCGRTPVTIHTYLWWCERFRGEKKRGKTQGVATNITAWQPSSCVLYICIMCGVRISFHGSVYLMMTATSPDFSRKGIILRSCCMLFTAPCAAVSLCVGVVGRGRAGVWGRVWVLGRLLGEKYDDGNGMRHRGIREHQIDIDGLGIFKFRPFCWICENQNPSRRSANNKTKQWYSRPVCWLKCGFCLLFGTVALDGLNSNLANWNACNACIFCGGRLSRESYLKRILIDWLTAVFLFSFSKVLMFQFSIKNWSRLWLCYSLILLYSIEFFSLNPIYFPILYYTNSISLSSPIQSTRFEIHSINISKNYWKKILVIFKKITYITENYKMELECRFMNKW